MEKIVFPRPMVIFKKDIFKILKLKPKHGLFNRFVYLLIHSLPFLLRLKASYRVLINVINKMRHLTSDLVELGLQQPELTKKTISNQCATKKKKKIAK